MKKWLIILLIIVAVGSISSAILAGKVYYSDLQTYEEHDEKEINTQALENVYIKSDVPIEIHPTKDKAYVEFTQKFTDLIGLAPKYQLEVEEKGNSTHISLTQVEDIILWLGVKENQAKLTVYLPEGMINRLDIEGVNYAMSSHQKQRINLENINVNNLKVNILNADIDLNGAYSKMNIVAANSTLNVKSTSASTLYTEGLIEQHIEGIFEKINIKGSTGDIDINSLKPCKVELQNRHGNMQLMGQYSKLNIEGDYVEIDLSSETECNLSTQGYHNIIYANGAFNRIDLEEQESEVEIQTTLIPESIKMVEEASRTSLSLTLPSNIPGITLKYINQNENEVHYSSDEVYDIDHNFANHEFKLDSEFLPINQEVKNGEFIYKYGNGQIPIFISKEAEISLELIDGGYTSISKAD